MAVASCKWIPISITGTEPSPRQGHSCAIHNNYIYLFGGATIQEDGDVVLYYNDMYRLVVINNVASWSVVTQHGDTPTGRDGHNLACVGGSLYLYGGQDQLYADDCLPVLYRFKISNGKWSVVNDDTVLCPRTLGHSLTHVDAALYTFGGIENGKVTDATYCFSTGSRSWSPLKTTGRLPQPRCDHAATAVGRIIYVFGGCAGERRWLNDLCCLDTLTLTWTDVEVAGVPPAPRAVHTLVAHRDKDVYVFGGEDGGGCMFDDVIKYSIGQCKWKRAMYSGMLPSPRQGHTALILHSTMFVIGGVSVREGEMHDVHALKLINPAERQPVLKDLMQHHGIPSKSLYFHPTVAPTLSYNMATPPYSTPRYKPACKTTERKVRDFSQIRARASKSIEEGIRAVEEVYYNIDVARSDLDQEKQDLKQRDEAYTQMYHKQQRELELKLEQHKAVTESWLRSRQRENNNDRKAIADMRCRVVEEQEELREAQYRVAEREKQLYGVLKQFQDV